MATQAILIADTIAGMKRAVTRSRGQISSDSEDSIDRFTNRGNKLKRKAHYVREGQLDRPNGPKVYKRKIDHAGYYRDVISRNPHRYDENGFPLEDDEEDEDADAAAAETNPYDGIMLQDLLGPLTSAADLPSHPSLSVPYISPILSNMTQEACEMVQRERNTVRGAKQLLTKLRGDDIWIPCSSLDSDIDDTIFDTSKVYEEIVRSRPASKSVGRKEAHNGPSSVASLDRTSVKILVGDRAMSQELEDEQATAVLLDQGVGSKASEGALESVSAPDTFNGPGEPQMNGNSVDSNRNDQGDGTTARQDFEVQARMTTHTEIEAQAANDANTITEMEQNDVDHPPDVNVEGPKRSTPEDVSGGDQQTSIGQEVTVDTLDANRQKSLAGSLIPSSEDQEDVTMLDAEDSQPANDDQQPIAHRMRTRAQAQAVSDNNVAIRTRSPSVASSSVPSIHPLFLIPRGACPDRDFGLPPEEAEATRRILMSYVQKQEEVCRGAEKLYNGLLKVERMKKDVFDSCKAEGHVGEMSDGEDWYDKEEWGLEEDLRKGHEEEEEEGGTQNKKTRGRKRET